jgi:hypothetical protein
MMDGIKDGLSMLAALIQQCISSVFKTSSLSFMLFIGWITVVIDRDTSTLPSNFGIPRIG